MSKRHEKRRQQREALHPERIPLKPKELEIDPEEKTKRKKKKAMSTLANLMAINEILKE